MYTVRSPVLYEDFHEPSRQNTEENLYSSAEYGHLIKDPSNSKVYYNLTPSKTSNSSFYDKNNSTVYDEGYYVPYTHTLENHYQNPYTCTIRRPSIDNGHGYHTLSHPLPNQPFNNNGTSEPNSLPYKSRFEPVKCCRPNPIYPPRHFRVNYENNPNIYPENRPTIYMETRPNVGLEINPNIDLETKHNGIVLENKTNGSLDSRTNVNFKTMTNLDGEPLYCECCNNYNYNNNNNNNYRLNINKDVPKPIPATSPPPLIPLTDIEESPKEVSSETSVIDDEDNFLQEQQPLDLTMCKAKKRIRLPNEDSLINDDNKNQWLEKIRSGTRSRVRNPKSWEFLMRLLLDERSNPSLIRWENQAAGTFRLIRKDEIAQIWGTRSRKTKELSYDNFARNLRYHYRTKKLIPVSERHLVYKFSDKVMDEIKKREEAKN